MTRRCLPLALLLACSALSSAEITPDQLLAKMQKAYGSVKTARFNVITRFMRAKTLVVSSKVQFSAPNKIALSTTGVPGLAAKDFTAVTDGKLVSMTGLPGGPITRAYQLDRFEQGMPQFNLETLCFWDWPRQLSRGPKGNMHESTFALRRENWNNANFYVLTETAAKQHVVVQYYVHPTSYLIYRTAQFDLGSKVPFQDEAISHLEINVPVPAATFAVH